MGSVVKKRRKRMAKKKHRKLLRKTRGSTPQQSSLINSFAGQQEVSMPKVVLVTSIPVPGWPHGANPH